MASSPAYCPFKSDRMKYVTEQANKRLKNVHKINVHGYMFVANEVAFGALT